MSDIFKSFEGFKRIQNTKKLNINEIFEKIKDLSFSFGTPEIAVIDGKTVIKFEEDIKKYDLLIEVNENQVIIYREKEDNFSNVNSAEKLEKIFSDAKSTSEIKINRAVEEVANIIEKIFLDEEIVLNEFDNILHFKLKREKIYSFRNILKGSEYIATDGKMKKYSISKSRNEKRIDFVDGNSKQTIFFIMFDEEKNTYNFLKYGSNFARMKYSSNISTCEFEKGKNTRDYKLETLEIIPDNTKLHYTIKIDNNIIASIDTIKFAIDSQYNIEIRNEDYENVVLGIAMVIEKYIGKNDDLKGE